MMKPFQLKKKSNGIYYLVVMLFILIGGEVIYFVHKKAQIEADKYEEIQAIGDLKSNQITQWIEERIGDVNVISRSPFFTVGVQKWLTHPENKEIKKEIFDRIHLVQSSYRYQAIYVVSKDAKKFIATNDDTLDFSSDLLPFFNQVLRDKKEVLSGFYHCLNHKAVHIDFLAPISSDDGELLAVLILRMDPKDYLYPLIKNWPTNSKTAESKLFKKMGDSVLFLSDLRAIQNAALTYSLPLSQKEDPAVQAILGHYGKFFGVDYRGKHVLSHVSAVKKTPWYMASKIDLKEIHQDLYWSIGYITLFILVVILLLFFAFRLANSQQRQKNIEALLEKERQIHQNQEESKIILYSIGDGVITTDTNGLITRMNPVAEQLIGYKEEECLGVSVSKVFKIIDEETCK